MFLSLRVSGLRILLLAACAAAAAAVCFEVRAATVSQTGASAVKVPAVMYHSLLKETR